MQSMKHATLVAALLAGLVPAHAQESQPPAETEASDAAPTEADAAPEAAAEAAPETAEQPAEGQRAAGETYVAEEHGDWQLRCVTVPEGQEEPCQLYQVLTDQNGGPVAEIVVFPLPEGQQAAAGAIITTPLETLLTEDVTIAVDGTEGRRYPFSFCTQQGCVSRIGLSQADIEAFQRGSVARVRIVPARAADQQVILEASLSGFTAGFAALEARGEDG